MTRKKLTPTEFLELVRPLIVKVDDDLYDHDFGDGPLLDAIKRMKCDSEAVEQWVESLDFRLEQARLAACDAWNLSLCDLLDDLEFRLTTERHEANPEPPKMPAKLPRNS